MNFQEAFDTLTADVIVRSSDGVHFRAHRLILSEASPVFGNMFRLLMRSTDKKKEPPVVPLSEDSETLEGLLRVCYPAKSMRFTDLGLLRKVMAAAEKYMMCSALETLGEALMSPAMLGREPVRAYALACRFRLRDVAVAAAKASLEHPLPVLSSPELEEASAQAYNDLILYRERCVGIVDSTKLDIRRVWEDRSLKMGVWNRSSLSCYSSAVCSCINWFQYTYRPFIKDLLRRRVSGAALMDPQSMLTIMQLSSQAGSKPDCIWKKMDHVLEIHLRYAASIDRKIADIVFEPSWR